MTYWTDKILYREIADLRSALEFYAEPANYQDGGYGGSGDSPVAMDSGHLARTALGIEAS